MSTLGQRLIQFREHTTLNQEAFADKCGVSQRNMSQWENDVHKPSRLLGKIIKAFPELNIDWLENGNGNMLLNVKKYSAVDQLRQVGSENTDSLKIELEYWKTQAMKHANTMMELDSNRAVLLQEKKQLEAELA